MDTETDPSRVKYVDIWIVDLVGKGQVTRRRLKIEKSKKEMIRGAQYDQPLTKVKSGRPDG